MTDHEGAIAMSIRALAVAPVAARTGTKRTASLVAANIRLDAGRSPSGDGAPCVAGSRRSRCGLLQARIWQ
jgi:hypothetical protein